MKRRHGHRAGAALGAIVLGAAPSAAVADDDPPEAGDVQPGDLAEGSDVPPPGEDDGSVEVPAPEGVEEVEAGPEDLGPGEVDAPPAAPAPAAPVAPAAAVGAPPPPNHP